MQKVLVTGGAGFIGSHLVDRLVAAQIPVVVLDDLSFGTRMNLERHGSKVELVVDRVERVGALLEALRGVDTVVHLAAQISGHDSLVEPEQYVAANVGGLLTLLRAMRELRCTRIVFASSATIYGQVGGEARRESDLPAPLTPYGLSKLAGEHLLRIYAPLWGFSHTSLRLFNVYGPRQSPMHPYANVTCKFAHAAAKKLPVVLYGDGLQARDFVFVDDVVDAFVRALEPTPSDVYNVGSGSEVSILELLDAVQRIGGASLEVEHRPAWPNDVRSVRADSSRLQRELRLRPRTPLDVGLLRTIESFGS
jgi:UDP-glucose 4-epimerase